MKHEVSSMGSDTPYHGCFAHSHSRDWLPQVQELCPEMPCHVKYRFLETRGNSSSGFLGLTTAEKLKLQLKAMTLVM